MIAIVVPVADEKLLAAISFQKSKEYKLYETPDWTKVEEPFVCVMEPGALPDLAFVKRVNRALRRHPDFDVYHVNLSSGKPFPRKASAKKLFILAILEGREAPLSSFVFRTEKLRPSAVFKADGSLDPLPSVLACAKEKPVRNVWRGQLEWSAPTPSKDPMAVERSIREKLELLRWTEEFFGDDDYPLSVGDQLKLFASELVKLYPSYSEEDLKEQMAGFQVAQGALRKLRAQSALKSALKERQKQLQ